MSLFFFSWRDSWILKTLYIFQLKISEFQNWGGRGQNGMKNSYLLLNVF